MIALRNGRAGEESKLEVPSLDSAMANMILLLNTVVSQDLVFSCKRAYLCAWTDLLEGLAWMQFEPS